VYPVSFADQVQDLRDTLKACSDGLAIAHNQVFDHGYRMFVVDLDMITFQDEVVINPSWTPQGASKMETQMEGCLSFPGMAFPIARHNFILLDYQDIAGNVKQAQLEGLAARMVQHECEHLDGKLFIEHIQKKKQIDVRNEVIRRRKAGRW
jgi:peptide deformylase